MFKLRPRAIALAALAAIATTAFGQSSDAPPKPSAPAATEAASQGKVAYYGAKFNGRRTASGERFDARALTMAHKTLPFGTLVRVTRIDGARSVVVRVNDRGPTSPDRVGDLSYAAAQKLRMLRPGVVEARLETIGVRKRAQARHA